MWAFGPILRGGEGVNVGVLAAIAACAAMAVAAGCSSDASDASRDVGGDALDGGGADSGMNPLRDDGARPDFRWDEKAQRLVDSQRLAEAMAEKGGGYRLPTNAHLLVIPIEPGVEYPAYAYFEAGLGGFAQVDWVASTIKLPAAVAALHRVHEEGFDGSATVTFPGETPETLRAIIRDSLIVSDNLDYSRTVRVTGFERMNEVFLTAENGFPNTVIQRSYIAGFSVIDVPGFTLSLDGREKAIPAYRTSRTYPCVGDGRPLPNCGNLFDLLNTIRRVMLNDEIPEPERFVLASSDVAFLQQTLLEVPSEFAGGVAQVLGEGAKIYNKTGSVSIDGYSYLDTAYIEDTASGARYLMGVNVPYTSCGRSFTSCRQALRDVASPALLAVRSLEATVVLQPDAGIPITVQIDASAGGKTFTVDAPGAERVELFVDASPLGEVTGTGRFTWTGQAPEGERLLIVRAYAGGARIGFRSTKVLL